MKSLWAILALLLAVMVGPLAILTFIPLGTAIQLEPVIRFGLACFAAGAMSITLALIAVLMAHESIEKVEEKIQEEAPKVES